MNRHEHFIRLTIVDDVLVIAPIGVFDGERIDELRQAVVAARQLGFPSIAVDLADSQFDGTDPAGAMPWTNGPVPDLDDVEWRNPPQASRSRRSWVEAHEWPTTAVDATVSMN